MKNIRNREIFRHIAGPVLLLTLLFCGFFPQRLSAATLTAGIYGEYTAADTETVLARINEIRLEACMEGLPNPADSYQTPLTLNDYVPLVWNNLLEREACLRAAEASVRWDHLRPAGGYSTDDLTAAGFSACGENIAWNAEGIARGIEQFYYEKADYLAGDYSAAGHYSALINPVFNCTGVSCFKYGLSGGFYTVTQELGLAYPRSRLYDTSPYGMSGTRIMMIEAGTDGMGLVIEQAKDDDKLSVSAPTDIRLGESVSLMALYDMNYVDYWGNYRNYKALISDTDMVSWSGPADSAVVFSETSSGMNTLTLQPTEAGMLHVEASVNGMSAGCWIRVLPRNVSSVTVRQTGAGSAGMTWPAADGAASYVIYRRTGTGSYVRIGETEKTSFEVSGLAGGNTYSFAVASAAAIGDSSYTGDMVAGADKVYTMKKPAKPAAAVTGKKKVTVTWDKVKNASGYELSYTVDGEEKTVDVSGRKKKIKVPVGTKFICRVRAYRIVDGEKIYTAWSARCSLKR